MRKKQRDLQKAKVAKQKKIVIVGSVLFLALLAFQVPRTMKMLHKEPQKFHHKRSAQVQTTPGTPTSMSPAPSTSAPALSTPVSNTSGVLTAELAPPAREGQLSVLSASFKSKDPFRQLIGESSGSAPSTDTSTATPTTTSSKPATADRASLKVVPSTAPETSSAVAAPAAPATPQAPKVTLPFVSAVISVNGKRQGVDVKVDFPNEAPLFHLVSLTKTTAKVSVSGGSLESGKTTLTLRRGKPLTLVNTADGTRFRLVLVKTSRTALKTPTTTTAAQTPSTETTAPAPTSDTPTTTTPTIGG
jgi:hypothetical protein